MFNYARVTRFSNFFRFLVALVQLDNGSGNKGGYNLKA